MAPDVAVAIGEIVIVAVSDGAGVSVGDVTPLARAFTPHAAAINPEPHEEASNPKTAPHHSSKHVRTFLQK